MRKRARYAVIFQITRPQKSGHVKLIIHSGKLTPDAIYDRWSTPTDGTIWLHRLFLDMP